MLIDFSDRERTTVDLPALNGPVTRMRGKYTVNPMRSLNAYGIQFVRMPSASIWEIRIEFRTMPPRRDDWNSTTKSDIDRVDDDPGRTLRVDCRSDRVCDVREAPDVRDAIPLLAREEHLGRRRVDEYEFVGADRAEPSKLVSRQLRRAEEVDVQGGLAGLGALDREVLAEDPLLGRLVAEQQQGRGPREAAAEAFVEDRDARLRPRARRPRSLHHIRTSGAGSWRN